MLNLVFGASGASCTSDAGGHFFKGTVTSDPWATIAYTSDSSEDTASGTVTVGTGGVSTTVEGRAMVIHDRVGNRIARGRGGGRCGS